MSLTNQVLRCLLLCSVAVTLTPAQAVRNSRPARARRQSVDVDTLTLNQRNALYLLEQLSLSAKEFADETLGVRTREQVADLLWPYDETQARRQFVDAYDAISTVKPATPAGAISAPPFTPATTLDGLRVEVLSLIAKRDADLAKKLITSAEEGAAGEESPAASAAAQRARRGLYFQAALGLAGDDPAAAVRLAKTGLGGAASPELLKVLFAVRQSSPALADDLFMAALAAARVDVENASVNIATLAAYALPEFAAPGMAAAAPAAAATRTASPLVREFLGFALDTFRRISGVAAQLGLPGAEGRVPPPNPIDYLTGQRLLPSFALHLPDKAMAFRQTLDTMARNLPPGGGSDAISKLFQGGGADDLLEQAGAEKNAHLRDLLYVRAAMSAAAAGEFEKAFSIVEKMGDAERRAGFDSVLRVQAAMAALKAEEVDAALRYSRGVSDLRQRAFLYGKIARALLDRGNAARAMEVLSDAEQAIGKAEDSVTKANALLIVAEVRSRLDPVQGFEALEGAVKAFNRADAGDSGPSRPANAGGNSVVSMMLNSVFKLDAPNFEPVFSRLAAVDFDRATQLARALERKDRSVPAQLAACRGVLSARAVIGPTTQRALKEK